MAIRTLTTEAEVSAYLHRSRLAILDALRQGPATISQVAAAMGVHPANLTRHLRTLERAGLVRLVEKRDTGRVTEKYYAPTADGFVVAPDTAGLTAPHRIALTVAGSELSAAATSLPDQTQGPVTALTVGARIPADRASAFAEELAALAERFAAADSGSGSPYRVVLALYPDAGATTGAPSVRLGR